MGNKGGRARCRRLAGALVLIVSAQMAAEGGLAATPDMTTSAAQAEQTYSFDIPSKPLPQAIADFSATTGLQVLYTEASAFAYTAPALKGTYTAQQGLDRLLAGSGLIGRFTSPTAVTVERPGQGGESDVTTLAPITVEAQSETADSPVEGYVARRSATGTKTDTPLIETPHSISVVTRDQVEAQGALTINEALRYTPGVVTETRGVASRYDGVQIRGFGSYIGTDQSTYLDGLRLLRNDWYSYTSIDRYTLERVELFRGPASVLYGQSSPGGLSSLVSKRPSGDALNEVELQAGSHDRYLGAFDLGGALDESDRYLFRVIGLARDSDSQIDFVEERRYLVAPSFTWRPTPDTELTLLASYQRDPESGFYGWVPANGTIQDNPIGEIPSSFFDGDPSFEKFERDQGMVGYSFDHRFDDVWSVRQNVRYTHLDIDYEQVYSLGLQADNRTLNRGTALTEEATNTIAIDNQLQSRFETGPVEHTLLAGLDYYRIDSDVQAGFGAAPTLDVFNPDYNQVIPVPAITNDSFDVQDQLGIYLQDQIAFDGLILSLGGRHDWADSSSKDRLAGTRTEQSDTAFTGKAGIVYVFDNGIAPYASYSESFLPVAGTDFNGDLFEPETGTQYEIGVKFQPEGSESFVGLSAFHLTRQNVTTGDPDHVGFSIQTGEIRSRGIELEAKLHLFDSLNAIAAYTFLDAEITSSNNGDEGNRPSSVPEQTASLWLDYTVQEGGLRGFGLGAGMRYVGEAYGDNANSFTVPDYAVFDAAARYDFGGLDKRLTGLELQLNVKNLLDKSYISSCEVSDAFCYFGARRTFLATLKYRW